MAVETERDNGLVTITTKTAIGHVLWQQTITSEIPQITADCKSSLLIFIVRTRCSQSTFSNYGSVCIAYASLLQTLK